MIIETDFECCGRPMRLFPAHSADQKFYCFECGDYEPYDADADAADDGEQEGRS
ncbi:hypothetical protein [Nocardia otitidiscaviarum]|uniref:hypothetical protein n=1 Tax=Nocardia otitidiscaviarum TaxID=1823 RepID=UPI0024548BDC|nr:hypothetical protein [Nocardia otitidiscaviarum]